MKRIVLIAISLLALLSCIKQAEQSSYPVLGQSPMDSVQEVETKGELYAKLSDSGLRYTKLVSLNSWSGLGSVPKDGGDAAIGPDNYVRALMERSVVGELYWVLPHNLFRDMMNAEGQMRQFLSSADFGLSEAELASMRFDSGCMHGEVSGAKIHVCKFSNVPLIKFPVTLDIGVDYFPVMAADYGVNKLGALKTTMDSLYARGLLVEGAYITYGIDEGRTRPIHRYIGEEIRQALMDPALLLQKTPPEPWLKRDMAENMFSGGEGEVVLKYIDDALAAMPDDQPLLLLKSAALVRVGKTSDAADIVDGLCKLDKINCSAMAYLAYIAGIEGKSDSELLRRADALMPQGYTRPSAFKYARGEAVKPDGDAQGAKPY